MEHAISVITINYNNAAGLRDTIASVINQDYPRIEYVVIDGGSTDGSLDVIKDNIDKINYWISEKDTGVYNAMNKGIMKVTSDYIIFLNSGDLFFNNQVVHSCNDFINKFAHIDIFYGDMFIKTQNAIEGYFYNHPRTLSLKFFKDETINHQASIIKKSLFNEFGLYPESYKLASDFWLFLSSLLADKKYMHIPFPMVEYDFAGISAADGFRNYKIEQKVIWDKLVPAYARILVEENEKLIAENMEYRKITNYTIVNKSIWLNGMFQKFKRIKN